MVTILFILTTIAVILLTKGSASQPVLEIVVESFDLPAFFIQGVNLLWGSVQNARLQDNDSHVVLQLVKCFLRI